MSRTFTLVAVLVASGTLAAQSQTKPVVTAKDAAKWESVGGIQFSPRGDWYVYSWNRDQESALKLKGPAADSLITLPYSSGAVFTADGKLLLYSVSVSPAERDKLQKEKKPVRSSLAIRKLATGETTLLADVASFTLSPDGNYLALRGYSAEGRQTADVSVYTIATKARVTFGNVSEYSWSGTKPILAFIVEPDGTSGNSIQIYDAASSAVRSLSAAATKYRGLTWRSKSDDLAAIRPNVESGFKDTSYLVTAWTGIGGGNPVQAQLDPSLATGLPAETRITEFSPIQWSSDGKMIFFGIRPRERLVDTPKGADKLSDVEIWHPKDVRTMQSQKLAEQRDLRMTMLAVWRLGDGRVLPIGTDLENQANVLPGGRYAVEIDSRPYGWGTMFGRRYQDVWVIDLTTGERHQALERVRHYFGGSPSGTKLAWFDGRDYWIQDIATRKNTNLTANLTGQQKVDFTNADDDHPSDIRPPIGSPSWAKGEGFLLVTDEYDIWRLATDGSGGVRLTDGAAERVVHRFMGPQRYGAPDEGVDLGKEQYLTLSGKWSKKTGFARLSPGEKPVRLIFADASIRGLTRADSAPIFSFTRERFDESPNIFLAGGDLANPRQITNSNPQQSDYAWGKAELIDYQSTVGRPLQAILYYPANYDPSKKYPMIVYTYERLTQQFHNYLGPPRETDAYNVPDFIANGYFVMLPDIVFRPREPGVAVLHSVEPAIRAVLARGLVDSARIGHCGHSQGGYEAAFLGTHSKLFATTVAGSGITDMISFAGQMHWGSGNAEFDHWETGQFRMEVPPWEDFQAMLDNSPLATVHEMPAKSMLVEIGSEDGVVDMRQGVEFYNYARRAGKNVVLLIYPGEGHGLGKKENSLDYHRRILQWFAYYLKGEPPAKWITDGQTWLERKAALDANK